MNNNIIVNVKDLRVSLDGHAVIEDLSLQVHKGEVLTILGPNGAGKTVLLRTLLGVLPYEGEIAWKSGIKLGYVPQRLPFIKDIPLSVNDFFELKKSSEKETDEILRSVGFREDLKKERIGELSSGQFQRVLIAWALIRNPQVLLFDEPTTGIDISGEETVYTLLERLQRERNLTMILVTHDLSVVYKFSTGVLCLNKHLVCSGPPRKVLTPESLRQLFGEEVKFYQHRHG
ncbi:MAG: metal ABC transporter ATP-binding protein [Nitrospirota bacterium]